MNMMKTIVIALAVLLGTAGVMAAEAKCDPKTGICEIPASGAEKVDCKKAGKFCWTVNPKWTHLKEYADDEVFQWYKRPDGALVLVYISRWYLDGSQR